MHMINSYYKYVRPFRKVAVIAGVFFAIYLAFTYLFPLLAPFITAGILTMINEPLISLMKKRFKLSRKVAAGISLLITIIVLGLVATFIIIKIYHELLILQGNVSTYVNSVSAQINAYFDNIKNYYNTLPYGIPEAVNENLKSLAPRIKDIISQIASYIISTITSIPKMSVFIIVTLLSTYFISSDREEIGKFLYRQMPENWSKNFSNIKADTLSALTGYIKAQIILIFLTFLEVSVGLFIIGSNYALVMGLLIALSDLIPILGTSIIMVPWIAWNALTGNMDFAIGLSIVYVLGVIMRQVLEPKIVGDQLGMHPLVTLVAMYIGLSLFGLMGMFVALITVVILRNLQNSGVVRIWNE